MRTLLTGSAGFVGRAVRRQPNAGDHDLVPLDRVDGTDVTDRAAVDAAVGGCTGVVHLAAKVGLEQGFDDVGDYVTSNDLGTATVLRAAAEAGVARFILASSMVVYGEGRYTCVEHGVVAPAARRSADLRRGQFDPPCPHCGRPLDPGLVPESAALDPRSIYAATKAHQEHLARVWAERTGGTVVALRFHNVYGPGMPRDTPYAGVASLFRAALARGEAPRVFEDGEQRRNFVHVDDVARAVLAALTAPLPLGVLVPVNVGSGTVTTVGAMAAALAEQVGGPAPVVTGEFRPGDVRHITADCSAAADLLGWTPRVSLRAGLAGIAAD